MAEYTLTLQIDDNGDELEITVAGEVAAAGLPPNQNDQRTRRGVAGKKHAIKDEKKNRHNSSHVHPDVIGPHLPLYLVNHNGAHNDNVVFQCAFAFVVAVSLDPGFDPPPGGARAPLNPFGWAVPQTGGPGAPINGRINKAGFPGGASRMDFYKITVWCNGKTLDPDLICETGP